MPNAREYLLPFDSSVHPIRISQGRNGPWSHKLITVKDYSNAVDFALPLETPVLASKAGRLFTHHDDSDLYYEGLDPLIGNSLRMMLAANFAFLLHEDGLTMAVYSHLAKGSVVEKPFFDTGETIAYTGRSGWIAQIPHLHFEVRATRTKSVLSLPVEFVNYNGSLDHQTLAKEGKIWFG